MTTCPTCETEAPGSPKYCPHCGERLQPFAVWPPAPSNDPPPAPLIRPRRLLLTKSPEHDITLGFALSWVVAALLWCINYRIPTFNPVSYPLLVGGYFGIRLRYPKLGRGYGFGLLSQLVIPLFLLIWLAVIFHTSGFLVPH